MQTRSSSKFVAESSTNLKRRNRRRSKQRVEPITLEEVPVVTMADQRTMTKLLRAPTEGYAEAIIVPPILPENFELTHSLINLDVPETSIKLMLFPFSVDVPAWIWLDKEPPHSILTKDNLVSKFINHFFPPNTASFSSSGSLPSNTVPNPREDLKAITTRSGVTLAGPSVSPPPSKEPSPTSTSFTPISSPKILESNLHNLRDLHFELSFADALLHMPKFALMFKSLMNNKEKLFDLATNPMNENCLAIILKKLPKKLGDPGKKFSLPELTPTQMILEYADQSTTRLAGIVKDVFVKVGKFHFPTDFVVDDYVVDPGVPLILERPFLRIGRALIDVYGEELTLRIDDEALTFKVGQTLKYSYNDAESINRINVIDVSYDDYYTIEGDILYLEKLLNEDPSPNLPPVKTEDLKQVNATMTKPSTKKPSELELKELPSHLEYTFLE
nr:hypothetical protein [Tanacetum cinerariifolium]